MMSCTEQRELNEKASAQIVGLFLRLEESYGALGNLDFVTVL